MGTIGRFVRTRLRRRIFMWFASGILLTALAVVVVMSALVRLDEPQWARSFRQGTAWFAEQFAVDWDQPAQREARARSAAGALGLDLELRDRSGQRLLLVGEECVHHPVDTAVRREGAIIGSIRACFQPMPGAQWRWGVGVGIAVLAMWVASGRVARRLARPLDELTDVVQRIGRGELSARAELSCHEPDELGVVADAVNDMAGRIEKQMKDQRELLATVSHELRTPLARMRVISEIARETQATPKTWDDLDREVQDMDGLVGELLASSRVEFGLVTVRTQPVKDLVLRALERAGVDAARASFEGGGEAVAGDPTLLQRALANLLENARRHAGGVDELHVSVKGPVVGFEVRDRGPGLPTGAAAVRFEKFRSQGEGDGLGLGLALVRRIAEAHRGRVWASNREGGGAAIGFEVWTRGEPPDLTAEPLSPSS